MGLTFGRARELWESIETTLLKGTYKIQHTLGPRAETIIWKDLGQVEAEGGGEAGGNLSPAWGHRHWRQSLLWAHSTMRTLVPANTTLQSSSSLLVSGPSLTHQDWDASDQAASQVGTQPYSQADWMLKMPERIGALGPSTIHQKAWDLAPDTNAWALALESLGSCSQRPWDLTPTQQLAGTSCKTSFIYQWAGMSPRVISNHLILCFPLLLLPSIFPSIRDFSNELALCIRWPKYWSFSISTSELISFRIDWFDLLAVQQTLKTLLQHHNLKSLVLHLAFFIVQLSHPYVTTGKTIALTIWAFVNKVMFLLFNKLSLS